MGGGEGKGAKEQEDPSDRSSLTTLLTSAARQLTPVLLTAGSLLGFVAFAGGVIVWTRFSAAKVPADQAVNAVPRDELVAIGSALLLLFGFFGILALAGTFLVDRGGRATPGMARALLLILLVEGTTTIVIAEGISAERTIAAVELFALAVGLAVWVTFVGGLVKLEDDLPTQEGERPGPRRYGMFLFDDEDWPEGSERDQLAVGGREKLHWAIVRAPLAISLVAIVVAGVLIGLDALERLAVGDVDLLIVLSVLTGLFLAAVVVAVAFEGGPVRKLIWKKRRELEAGERSRLRQRKDPQDGGDERLRLLNDRPMRLSLRVWGTTLTLIAVPPAALLPWALLGEWWIAASIAAAAILTVGLWRIATLAAERIVWFGVAVFLSVPLFGTLSAMARNIANPQVQPMALIRALDGPAEAIQGLYVTEADDRVYFATVATEGCGKELMPHSGRLEWVPKDEVVAMSIGPLQDVDDAAESALEMAYALTPGVDDEADEPTLAVTQKAERRLEDTGPAVRPNFGAGLSVTPEDASPGEVVTLRVSAPNRDADVGGFGSTRSGRTLRVGGARATILKEVARSAEGAEFVQTLEGKLLKLDKAGPFVRKLDGHFVSLEQVAGPHGRHRYVKLADPAALAVADAEMPASSRHLQLRGGRPFPVLVPSSRVVEIVEPANESQLTRRPSTVQLKARPLGQAWHEKAIKFVVPENASSGAVSVECSQLSGQPLLDVARAPDARISVQMRSGSSRVSFDSSRSSDADDEQISRRWEVAGMLRGNLTEMFTDLPARRSPYDITLTATDESGRTDTVELHLLRLPASLFDLDEARPRDEDSLKKARTALVEAIETDPPVTIEIAGHADDPGTFRHNVRLSRRRAGYVRDQLLQGRLPGIPDGAEVAVRTLAYGETCPLDPRPGPHSRNRRVDVFVLHQGVSMAPLGGCHPRRFESMDLRLPALVPRDQSGCAKPGEEVGGLLRLILGALAGDRGAKCYRDAHGARRRP